MFIVNLEMYKATIIYQILFFFICKHNNVGRDRVSKIVVQVFNSISLNYVTCESSIQLLLFLASTKLFLRLNSNF